MYLCFRVRRSYLGMKTFLSLTTRNGMLYARVLDGLATRHFPVWFIFPNAETEMDFVVPCAHRSTWRPCLHRRLQGTSSFAMFKVKNSASKNTNCAYAEQTLCQTSV